jgi:hypothetical protein
MPNDAAKEQEYKDEAERLALLPLADQREIIALHRSVADNPKVKKADRQLARDKADTLEKLLRRLNREKKNL